MRLIRKCISTAVSVVIGLGITVTSQNADAETIRFNKTTTFNVEQLARTNTLNEIYFNPQKNVLFTEFSPKSKKGEQITFYNSGGKEIYTHYYPYSASIYLMQHGIGDGDGDQKPFTILSPNNAKLYMAEEGDRTNPRKETLLEYDTTTLKLKRIPIKHPNAESITGFIGTNDSKTILYFQANPVDENREVVSIVSVDLKNNYKTEFEQAKFGDFENPDSKWNVIGHNAYSRYSSAVISANTKKYFTSTAVFHTSFEKSYKSTYGNSAVLKNIKTTRFGIGEKMYFFNTFTINVGSKNKYQSYLYIAKKSNPTKILKTVNLGTTYGVPTVLDNQTFIFTSKGTNHASLIDVSGKIYQTFIGEVQDYPKSDTLLIHDPQKQELKVYKQYSEFTNVKKLDNSIVVDLKYNTTNNFTGKRIYNFNQAILRTSTAKKLVQVNKELKKQRYVLKIWDAYRPYKAQEALWNAYPNPTYVAKPNPNNIRGHMLGATVDVALCTLDGKEVKMQSGFDDFSNRAHRDYKRASTQEQYYQILDKAMIQAGFVGYKNEWWHYSDNNQNFEPMQVDPTKY